MCEPLLFQSKGKAGRVQAEARDNARPTMDGGGHCGIEIGCTKDESILTVTAVLCPHVSPPGSALRRIADFSTAPHVLQ